MTVDNKQGVYHPGDPEQQGEKNADDALDGFTTKKTATGGSRIANRYRIVRFPVPFGNLRSTQMWEVSTAAW